jgi:putative CocE/NonD family hydrolase
MATSGSRRSTWAAGFDIFLGGTLENFRRLRDDGGSPAARAHTRLLIGPWGHGSAFGAYPDHELPGLEAPIDLAELQLEFFDRHLRGGAADDGEAPVRIFVMGEAHWRDEPDWPPPKASVERWFLRRSGLSPEAPADEPHDEYVYDSRDPAPTIGGPTSLPGRLMKPSAGPLDQRPLERREDMLVYTSEQLERPLEVTGPLELVLYAASSAPDTDFVGKLCDALAPARQRVFHDADRPSHLLLPVVRR